MVEIIHTPSKQGKNGVFNDHYTINGDDLEEIISFCSVRVRPKSWLFYKEELKKNGFKPEPGMEDLINEKGGMLKWNKAERDVELMMSFNSESNSTDIVLSYKEKK